MLPENAIALDARLSAIRDLAGSCARFADIGADHGRLGAHMLLHGLCERAQLADISEASLAKARRLIYGLGLTGRVDFCVGDGAQALKGPPDVAVVAGYSFVPMVVGNLVCAVLSNGLTLRESGILGIVSAAATAYSFILLFIGVMTVHRLTALGAAANILLTLVGMLLLLFLLVTEPKLIG